MAINLIDRYKEFNDFYLQAKNSFKQKNYPVTISLLRSALERFSLIILCDVEDEATIEKLLKGEYVYRKEREHIYNPDEFAQRRSNGTLRKNPDGFFNVSRIDIIRIEKQSCSSNRKEIQSRGLVFAAQSGVISFMYQNKYVHLTDYKDKKEYHEDEQRIWDLFKELGNYYGDGSKKIHPGKLRIDEATASKDFLFRFENLSEYLRAISAWSEESRQKLSYLIKSDENIVTDTNDTAEAANANNEIDRLKISTCDFSPEQKYILILPENTDDYDFNSDENKYAFYALIKSFKPILVIDFNKNTQDGPYKNISDLHDHIHILDSSESEDSYITDSEYINWLFAQGNIESPTSMNKEWGDYRRGILRLTEKTCKKTSPTNIAVISFTSDLKRTIKIFERIHDNLSDANFYILSKDRDVEENCQKFQETHEELVLNHFGISIFELAKNIVAAKGTNESNSFQQSGDCRLYFKGQSITIPSAEVLSYKEAGIELIKDSATYDDKDDFYAGGEITWNDLSQHKDVDRDRWNDLLKQVEDLINKSNDTILSFSILHEPGAGATTLSRRLAYEIEKKNKRNELQRSCNVVVLFKNIRESDRTINQLIKLSQKTENNRLMVLYESCNISKTEIDSLISKLGSEGEKRKMLFVNVRPVQQANTSKPRPHAFVLSDQLSIEEFNRFSQKYKSLNMSSKNQKKMEALESPNVIDFPLLLHEGEVSQNLQRYIDNQMNRLPEALKKTVALLSFAYYYSGQMSVNIQLFRSVFKDDNHSLLGSYKLTERNVLNKLLLRDKMQEDNNYYRPRYSKFAEFILQNYFGRNNISSWNKYPGLLANAAIQFIDACRSYGEDGINEDLFLSIFVLRRDDNYRADDDRRFITKFSKLIQDINEPDRANEVLKHLCNTFPDDPYYNAHYGRFLFERAKENKCSYRDELFKQAKKYVEIAIDNNKDNSDVYHIRGMYFSRLVGSLRNTEVNETNSADMLSLLKEWTKSAVESFAESESRANDSAEYSYAAEASLYKLSIELVRQIIDSEDYKFCDEEPWCEYVENLGKALTMLGNVINNNENINQKANSIYGNLLAYYSGIFGKNIEETANGFFQQIHNGKLDLGRRCTFGKLYYSVSIYGRMNRDHMDRRDVYRKLNEEHYSRLEQVLENNIKLGDLESYDKLFELRLYGRGRKNVYTLEEAKNFVSEWHDMIKERKGQSLLTSTFYLGVINAALAIVAEHKREGSKVYEVNATRYFQEASELAKELKKKTYVDYCAMGRLEDDIRCLVRLDSPNNDKSIISGVFTKIKGDKSGVVKLDCGLEATLRFDDKEIPDEVDAGKVRYKGTIHFRYAGLAMFGATKV